MVICNLSLYGSDSVFEFTSDVSKRAGSSESDIPSIGDSNTKLKKNQARKIMDIPTIHDHQLDSPVFVC